MNYYNEIKQELINNEITKRVKDYSKNRSDLNAYYNVGKMLSEAGKHYGENIIGDYAQKLKAELNKKYNERTLRRYRQFYNFVTNLKWSAMPTKLSWSHITELMILSDEDEINYYVSMYKPFDKAGSYGIQEWIGYVGVKSVEGSYFNVMGLPTQKLYQILKRF